MTATGEAASDETANAPRPAAAPTTQPDRMGLSASLLVLLTAALWGGTPVAVSFSQDELPPVFVAGLRFAQAAVFMLFWCRWEGSDLRLRPGQHGPAWMLASMLFIQISLFHVAIKWSNTSHATVLINTFVFWVAAIEHFVTKTVRLSGAQALGLLFAGIGGATILITQDSPRSSSIAVAGDAASLAGDLAMVASAFILAIKVIYTKHALKVMEPGKLIFWHDVFGVLMFFAWSAAFESIPFKPVGWPTIVGLFYQGVIVAGFCFALQALLLKWFSASQISIYSVSTPLFGLFFSWLFRGDSLSPWLIFAGICVAVGILLVNRKPAARETAIAD